MGNPENNRCSMESDLIDRLLRTELSDADSPKSSESQHSTTSIDLSDSDTCKYCHFKTDSPLHRNIHSQMHRRRVIRDALNGLGWRSAKSRQDQFCDTPRDNGGTRILKEMVLRTSVGKTGIGHRTAPIHWTSMGRVIRVDRGLVHKVLPRRMHECRRCGIFFRDALLHRLHMAMHAPGCAPFVCRLCGFQAESALRFFEHVNETAHDEESCAEEAVDLRQSSLVQES